jgi:hypothetical protein
MKTIAEQSVRISYGVCQEVLTEHLNMHRIATK